MTMYTFDSKFETVGKMPYFSDNIIRKEPMLFGCDKEFAMRNGGEITKVFISNFLNDNHNWIIDSRVHMLMEGWYPCIPGWHHDDIPRYTDDGQPNYDNPEYKALHRMVVIGNSALPQFIFKKVSLPKITTGIIYDEWNKCLNHDIHKYHIDSPESGEVIDFNSESFHRGTASETSCWRFFIRASRDTTRQFYNEIRINAQVYLPQPEKGW